MALTTIKRTIISEGFDTFGTPDLKYYAFDWDDNIMFMPTEIILLDVNGNEIGMSTHDFAKYRSDIGKKPFRYKGTMVVDYATNPFRNFRENGDKQFLQDVKTGRPGPSWNDFVEAINNGSIFSIITARGHNPLTLKKAVNNLIRSNYNGINSRSLIRNLKKYRDIMGTNETDNELISNYLDLCEFYPVSFNNEENVKSPEQLKIEALAKFIKSVKRHAKILKKKLYLKDNIKNKFIPSIGFSDDDPKNIEAIRKKFIKEPLLRTYLTNKGTKEKG